MATTSSSGSESGEGRGARSVETTGRFVVVFEDAGLDAGAAALSSGPGIELQRVTGPDLISGMAEEAAESGEPIALETLGVAVVEAEPDRRAAMGATADASPAIRHVVPERWLYAIDDPSPGVGFPTAPPFFDSSVATWGIHATKAFSSRLTGRGVKVAVLDSGLDLDHPDYSGRSIKSQSFVAGEEVQDVHGHGTHCAGTLGGKPMLLPRYGVAPDCELHVGKVLGGPDVRGTSGDILRGMAWAIASRCRVISMSLGGPPDPANPIDAAFEEAGRRALAAGSLVVAAAGNDSNRPHQVAPVSTPANCPSIMAVGGLDQHLGMYLRSNAGTAPGPGQVDIAAPGVGVHSSWPMPQRYRTIQGTSMATPHVAGLAALLAEAHPAAPASELWSRLTQAAQRLPLPSTDVGVGLACAEA